MLVMFDSFNDFFFFAILCSVIRKVLQRRKLSHDDRDIGGIRVSCLEKQSEIPMPLHH